MNIAFSNVNHPIYTIIHKTNYIYFNKSTLEYSRFRDTKILLQKIKTNLLHGPD